MSKKRKHYKARSKSVQKMTRDGLVQENRSTGEISRISSRSIEQEFRRSDSISEELRHTTGTRQEFHPARKDATQDRDAPPKRSYPQESASLYIEETPSNIDQFRQYEVSDYREFKPVTQDHRRYRQAQTSHLSEASTSSPLVSAQQEASLNQSEPSISPFVHQTKEVPSDPYHADSLHTPVTDSVKEPRFQMESPRQGLQVSHRGASPQQNDSYQNVFQDHSYVSHMAEQESKPASPNHRRYRQEQTSHLSEESASSPLVSAQQEASLIQPEPSVTPFVHQTKEVSSDPIHADSHHTPVTDSVEEPRFQMETPRQGLQVSHREAIPQQNDSFPNAFQEHSYVSHMAEQESKPASQSHRRYRQAQTSHLSEESASSPLVSAQQEASLIQSEPSITPFVHQTKEVPSDPYHADALLTPVTDSVEEPRFQMESPRQRLQVRHRKASPQQNDSFQNAFQEHSYVSHMAEQDAKPASQNHRRYRQEQTSHLSEESASSSLVSAQQEASLNQSEPSISPFVHQTKEVPSDPIHADALLTPVTDPVKEPRFQMESSRQGLQVSHRKASPQQNDSYQKGFQEHSDVSHTAEQDAKPATQSHRRYRQAQTLLSSEESVFSPPASALPKVQNQLQSYHSDSKHSADQEKRPPTDNGIALTHRMESRPAEALPKKDSFEFPKAELPITQSKENLSEAPILRPVEAESPAKLSFQERKESALGERKESIQESPKKKEETFSQKKPETLRHHRSSLDPVQPKTNPDDVSSVKKTDSRHKPQTPSSRPPDPALSAHPVTPCKDNGVALNHRDETSAPAKPKKDSDITRGTALKRKEKVDASTMTVGKKKQIRRTYQEQANRSAKDKSRQSDSVLMEEKTANNLLSDTVSARATVLKAPKKPDHLKEKPSLSDALLVDSNDDVAEAKKKLKKSASGSEKKAASKQKDPAGKRRGTLKYEPIEERSLSAEEKTNRFRSIHAPVSEEALRAAAKAKKKREQRRLLENDPKKAKSASKFVLDAEDTSGKPSVIGSIKKGAITASGVAAHAAIGTAGSILRDKVREAGDDNLGMEALERTEYVTEQGVRSANRRQKSVSAKNRERKKPSRLQSSPENSSAFHTGEIPKKKEEAQKKNLLNRYFQKRRNKQRAKEAARAAKNGGKAAKNTATTTVSFTEKAAVAVKTIFQRKKTAIYVLIALVLVLILLISQLQSCTAVLTQTLGAVTISSWPADDQEITKADAYYSKLEAELQKKIDTVERSYPGYDEYNYNVGEIGHDPVVLISYLCAKYGAFTFNQTIKQELDTLFSKQYSYSVQTANETRTVTKTVRAGDSLGMVITSGYCNCSICCGQWAGGPTASGVYPTANHSVAVDAYNPIVPMGTEIIMDGKLYKVEDTGNLNAHGVNFDVYYDDHTTASNHGHQTYEAFYAGGDGEEIEVTTTETVKVCYVTLTSTGLGSVISTRLNSDQIETYSIYIQSRGNRQFLGTPVSGYWYGYISSHYGYRTKNGVMEMHHGLDISPAAGTTILSVLDGTVTQTGQNSTYGRYIVLENADDYKILYAHCASFSVSQGQTVTIGDEIGTVGSTGNVSTPTLHIEFQYEGDEYNPYFYLSCEGASLPGTVGNATGAAAILIQEAQRYLGTPYVWGGYSPSGFDCSGYVSYCLTNSGVRNTGHLTANGLLNICTRVSKDQLQPGDLVFFEGTYNVTGASHVGIYIGSGEYGTGTFIHCGDPCKYGDLNSSYWVQHWLTGGRWY